MPEISLSVIVDPTLEGLIPEAISYETGLTRKEVSDPTLYAYDHHGIEFTSTDPGALTSFYEDLLQGRPMPLKFATKEIRGIDTLVALALFYHRDLVTHPNTPGLIYAADLVHRRGIPAYAHIDSELAEFFRTLEYMFVGKQTREEIGEAIRQSIAWLYEYVTNDNIPNISRNRPEPQILEVGSQGFVLAQNNTHDLLRGWVELYRMGFLKGFLVSPEGDEYRHVLASRKSLYLQFDLSKAASLLNSVEEALGNSPEWQASELWLSSPPHGTVILVRDLLEIFVRV